MIILFLFLAAGGVLSDDFFSQDKEIAQSGKQFSLRLSRDPVMIINRNLSLVAEAENMESNNNVAAKIFQDRLYVAWRTAPVHFASRDTRIHIASSGDMGTTWEFENTIFLGSDLREPFFIESSGNLYFSFFQGGTNPIDFEPQGLFRTQMLEKGVWSKPEVYGHAGEVVWEIVQFNGTLYSQSYSGDYSTPGDPQDLGKLDLFFNRSENGIDWEPVGVESVYKGGLTEVGFEFDVDGNLWGVARNEDGDDSGWGSRLFYAASDDLSNWIFADEEQSNPVIYESPKMFRHGNDLYLVARTDPDGVFWTRDNPLLNILPAWEHHLADLVSFSLRQHGTAIWKLDQQTGELTKVLDLVGCGDTAFPSIVRISRDKYIIFNYSSTMGENCPANWIMGQVSPAGSVIYQQEIEFEEI